MKRIALQHRLRLLAEMTPPGGRLADIGTDHGYLPVWLLQEGRIPSAIAADVGAEPLEHARRTAEEYETQGLDFRLCDGLSGIEPEETDTVVIAGMGGELIAAILSDCSAVRDKHLILNPMTHSEITRSWLYLNGFLIKNDIIVKDGKHFYNIIDAEYGGEPFEPTQTQCFLGNIYDFSQKEYFNHLLNYLRNKEKGGADYSKVIKAIEDKI